MAKQEYDWIDDAFDEKKEDPLANKGLTGCSGLAVLLCVIVVVGIVLFAGLGAFGFAATLFAA